MTERRNGLLGPKDALAPELLRSVASWGLPRQVASGEQARLVEQDSWDVVLLRLRQQRLLGLFLAAACDGAISLSDDQFEQARQECIAALCGDLVRERELIHIVGQLTQAGIDHRVLKGPAVAHLDYEDPALRSFVDVDLLVQAEQWDDAMRALQRSGWQRQFGEPRPGFDRRFVKAMAMTRPAGKTELDLHRTLVLGPFGLTVALRDLWSGFEPLRLTDDGLELRALRREVRFLHACFHAALGDLPARLVPLRDVAQIALSEALDLDCVIELTRSWRAEAVVARAALLAVQSLEIDDPRLHRLCELSPPARQIRALSSYIDPSRSYVRLTVAATGAIRNPVDKVRYVIALAAPRRDFVSSRYANRRTRWVAAARTLTSGRGSWVRTRARG